jgi:hypothetical protein
MIIQSGVETGWGNNNSNPDNRLMELNNYFGQHGVGSSGKVPCCGGKDTLAKFSDPQDCYDDYCVRNFGEGVTPGDDEPFLRQVVYKRGFAVGRVGGQEGYIKGILSFMKKCEEELKACCCK